MIGEENVVFPQRIHPLRVRESRIEPLTGGSTQLGSCLLHECLSGRRQVALPIVAQEICDQVRHEMRLIRHCRTARGAFLFINCEFIV